MIVPDRERCECCGAELEDDFELGPELVPESPTSPETLAHAYAASVVALAITSALVLVEDPTGPGGFRLALREPEAPK